MARRSVNTPAAGDVLVAQDNAYVSVRGRLVMVHQGRTTARAGHPIVAAAPGLWAPIVVDYDTAPPEPEPVPVPAPAPTPAPAVVSPKHAETSSDVDPHA